MMKRILLAAFVALCPTLALAGAGNIVVLDGNGVLRTYDVITDGSGNFVGKFGLCDGTAAATCAAVKAGNTALTTDAAVVVSDPNVLAAVKGSIPAGPNLIGTVGIDQTTPGTTNLVALAANQSVNVAQINGVTPLMGAGITGTGSPRVTVATDQAALAAAGQGATGATTPTAATASGCNAVSAWPSAVTTGQMRVPNCGLSGDVITRLYAPKELAVSGTTAAMTGTTSTQLIAAVASNKIYLSTLTCGNSHATVGTFVNVQDGSGGTTLWTVPAGAVYGGATLNFTPPIPTTSGNGVYVADATTGANVICSGVGYSGP